MDKHDSPVQPPNQPPPEQPADEANAPTRRRFLREVGKKARYAAPLILTLAVTSQRVCASEAGPEPSCIPSGEACAQNSDCCSDRCDVGVSDKCLPPL